MAPRIRERDLPKEKRQIRLEQDKLALLQRIEEGKRVMGEEDECILY